MESPNIQRIRKDGRKYWCKCRASNQCRFQISRESVPSLLSYHSRNHQNIPMLLCVRENEKYPVLKIWKAIREGFKCWPYQFFLICFLNIQFSLQWDMKYVIWFFWCFLKIFILLGWRGSVEKIEWLYRQCAPGIASTLMQQVLNTIQIWFLAQYRSYYFFKIYLKICTETFSV